MYVLAPGSIFRFLNSYKKFVSLNSDYLHNPLLEFKGSYAFQCHNPQKLNHGGDGDEN